MIIRLHGLGRQGIIGDPDTPSSTPVIGFFHDNTRDMLMKKAWESLTRAGVVNDSFVEVIASEVTDKDGKRSPYAVVIYKDKIETYEQVGKVVRYLTDVAGINVEEPLPSKFYPRKE